MNLFTESMLDTEQVATALGMSRSTMYRLIEQGLLPKRAIVFGNKALWKEADIHEWKECRAARAGLLQETGGATGAVEESGVNDERERGASEHDGV